MHVILHRLLLALAILLVSRPGIALTNTRKDRVNRWEKNFSRASERYIIPSISGQCSNKQSLVDVVKVIVWKRQLLCHVCNLKVAVERLDFIGKLLCNINTVES